jgi:LysM repeat protein
MRALTGLFLLLIVLFTSVTEVQAQGDRVIVERQGQSYFVHSVKEGHTLYSISKLYNTPIESIVEANPELKDGLKLGQTLYIPVPDDHDADEWTNPIRIESDGFMIHRVKRKETLYGISRQYTVDINRLLELNPGVDLGLKPGVELRIPPNDIDEPATAIAEPDENDGWQKHKVAPGETLYSISKQYGVSQKSIVSLNMGLEEGLRAGEEILIPVKDPLFIKQTEPTEFVLELPDTSFYKDQYNVVLMLPFELDAQPTEEGGTDKRKERLQEIAMSYYRGAMAALDTLKARGAHLNVTVLDVSSEQDAEQATKSRAVQEAHLIIGPLQRKALEVVANYTARKGTHLVCPTPQSNRVLLASPNLSKAFPSSDSEMSALATYVAQKHRADNVVLIDTKTLSEARMVQLFRKHYVLAYGGPDSIAVASLHRLECSNKFVGELEKKLKRDRLNVLVVPAGDDSRSMIANLQSRIQLLGDDYRVKLYAPNTWLEYDFLDYSFKERTSLVVPGALHANYNTPLVQSFVTSFRETFNAEPSQYAFVGYDVMLFYGNGLLQYGINFPNRFDRVQRNGLLQMNFDYHKTGLESGYENRHIFLLEHNDFELQPISLNGPQADR